MKLSLLANLILLGTSSVVAQFLNQSAPFHLVLHSSNKTIDGSFLGACHEGAAIEGLCLQPPSSGASGSFVEFRFNTSTTPYKGNKTIGEQGYLTWELQGAGFYLSEPLGLLYSPISNVAVPQFDPGPTFATAVAFDDKDKLNIQGLTYTSTAEGTNNELVAYYHWYICQTNAGYQLTTLAWVVGVDPPDNPTCVATDVKRVFLS